MSHYKIISQFKQLSTANQHKILRN